MREDGWMHWRRNTRDWPSTLVISFFMTHFHSIMESDGQWRTHKHKNYQEGSKKKMTVLSVDDDPTNQMVVQKLLDAHFNIVQAMSGQEALDIISNSAKPPDFVLLDVMMPKMSGLEVFLISLTFPLPNLLT